MNKIIHTQVDGKELEHHNNGDYEYYQKKIVSGDEAKQCIVSVYELPPKKSSYPYHYHLETEECFYIISGLGLLKTPEGEKQVNAGDIIFFPANKQGAHKLTNTSESENLVYIDFDTTNHVDVVLYPDSNKVGVYNKDFSQLHMTENNVDYFEGE